MNREKKIKTDNLYITAIKKYIIGKLLQGIIAATYTYILITILPMVNLNL